MNRRQFVLDAGMLTGGLMAADVAALGGVALVHNHTPQIPDEKNQTLGCVVVSDTEVAHVKARGISVRDLVQTKCRNLERSIIAHLEETGKL